MIGPGTVIVVATRNRGKTQEFRAAFSEMGAEVRDLNETAGVPPVEETGATFAENARLKARKTALHLGLPVLADDSGLCVDALGGAPGVYSARYAGEGATDADNNAKLLRELNALPASKSGFVAGDPTRFGSARFVCALALYVPDSDTFVEAEGTVEGFILASPKGDGGFGYDPLFWLPEFGRSMAELSTAEKNKISHRGAAIRNLIEKFRS
jgi:XTP/dITP diphosphohydrolase